MILALLVPLVFGELTGSWAIMTTALVLLVFGELAGGEYEDLKKASCWRPWFLGSLQEDFNILVQEDAVGTLDFWGAYRRAGS
jgi:hypothetical protein